MRLTILKPLVALLVLSRWMQQVFVSAQKKKCTGKRVRRKIKLGNGKKAQTFSKCCRRKEKLFFTFYKKRPKVQCCPKKITLFINRRGKCIKQCPAGKGFLQPTKMWEKRLFGPGKCCKVGCTLKRKRANKQGKFRCTCPTSLTSQTSLPTKSPAETPTAGPLPATASPTTGNPTTVPISASQNMISLTVQGSCILYQYEGPESGLHGDFEAFWNANSACGDKDCGSLVAAVDPDTNRICWSWAACGINCPNGVPYTNKSAMSATPTVSPTANTSNPTSAPVSGSPTVRHTMIPTTYNPTTDAPVSASPTFGPTISPTPLEDEIITLTVQGSCKRYQYEGPESGLQADFEAFWNANAACGDKDCGGLTAAVDQRENRICWSWEKCGTTCPNGVSYAVKAT